MEIDTTIDIDFFQLLPTEDYDLDRVFDLVSEKATGSILLQAIVLKPEKVNADGSIRLRVTGLIEPSELEEDERDRIESLIAEQNNS